MCDRQRVNSPDELQAGDRVDLVGDDGTVSLDLLYRRGTWWGVLVAVPPGFHGGQQAGQYIPMGGSVFIARSSYPEGRVFLRRRAREDHRRARTRELARG